MNKNLIKYKDMGYKEIVKGEIDHVMYKQFDNRNTWLVAFNNEDDSPVCLYLSSNQIQELKEILR